ncbi:MAG: hypothetical protein DRJ02_08950 [Bacteroidetes bacterium]|nr:MAG: hypothetical protein DRI72_00365 [Bacteroidota bacterium]RLD73179.1 MAG: hypothetical protein DRI87_04625 [Bacteroidota bacterium]RLD86263.1 MAG: hypothetical protein DRJ02_08950 [Bacteroidota bacterium]
MLRLAKILFIPLVLSGLIFLSCRKFEEYPVEPAIEFKDFLLEYNLETGKTERGVLIFSYTDGDGDLGLGPEDTRPPFNLGGDYYYNLIIKYFERQNGVFIEVPLLAWNPDSARYDTLTFNTRFPKLIPEVLDKPIKGVFNDTLFILNPLSQYDTIKFSAYIIDRALHESNTIETPPIVRINK